MSNYQALDIKELFNHKLVYQKLPKINAYKEFGLDNVCVLREDIKFKTEEIIDKVNFKFNFLGKDNVVCDGQQIKVNLHANKIHFVSFAYWGDTNEFFQIVYDDESIEKIKVPFIDWSHEVRTDSNSIAWYGNNIKTCKKVVTSGAITMLVHFHHTVCELKQNKIIKEIIFPYNMFTHVFAVTLEENNKGE